ncbi:YfiR family protein [Asticcacaulis solisilvae]|uniref:YfiR family protein n=1 Tax=Asticcacaulis solisilvae TaxID=1217274 RepID=UPI003FD6F39E
MWRRVLLCVVCLATAQPAGARTSALETSVKATYLYKFAPFVTWPQSDPSKPFTICVVGADPFGAVLDQAVAGQVYAQRPIQVTRLETVSKQSGCDIAYLGGSRAQPVEAGLQALRGAPVLTVTDEGTPEGMIAFRLADGHVRFRIDQDAADEAGLTISSKLLSLALAVKTRGGPA